MDANRLNELFNALIRRVISCEDIPEEERLSAAHAILGSAAPYCRKGSMSAVYYNAPRDGKKLARHFTGVLPKTMIFADNSFELELLRLLCKWLPEDEKVEKMRLSTLSRLRNTCFGGFCPQGECVGASVAALRFYEAASPDEPAVKDIVHGLCGLWRERGTGMAAYKQNIPLFYVFLAFTGLNTDEALSFISENEGFIRGILTRGCLTGPAVQDTYNKTALYILRNALATLPGCACALGQPVYVRENGRLYCDV